MNKITLRSHAALDKESRKLKASKIEQILSLMNSKDKKILDVGTGAGYIPYHLGVRHKVTSVDIVDERKVKENYVFKRTKDSNLPVNSGIFEFVISNQVIEHIPNQQAHIRELKRTVKKKGKVYIATPNRYWVVDPHTKLPFINWLPRKMANYYTSSTGNGNWDVYPVGYFKLLGLLKKEGFVIEKNSYDVINTIWDDESIRGVYRLIYRLTPKFILKTAKFLYPSMIFVVRAPM